MPSLRRASLEQTLQQAELLHSCEEEEAWLREHGQLVEDASPGPDLSQISAALQKHKVPSTLHPASSPLPAIHPFPHPAPSSAPRGLSHPSPFSFPQVHLGDADYLQDLCWALVREWAPRLKGPALELPGELSDSEPHLGVSQRVPNQGWS